MNSGLRTTWLPVALTLGTGMVDVASFARLGGVFSSVITGNLVLIGLAASSRAAATVVHAVVAVAAYIVGVGLGTRIAGDTGQIWTRRVSHTLLAEMALLAAACGGWIAVSARPGDLGQLLIVSATAAAMGMQSAAVQAAGIPVSTTYLTGTVTALVTGLIRRGGHRTPPRVALAALIALPCGAAIGGVMLRFEPRIVLVIPLALLGIVVALMERKGPTDGLQAGPGTSAG